MAKQQTLRDTAVYSGIALHTGARSTLRFLPAPPDSGIVFRRIDLEGAPSVRAMADKVVDIRRGTTIGDGECVVHTVEHIMATLHALEIDNVIVDMDGPEPPIADGSAKPFLDAVLGAGLVEQDAEARYFEPSHPLFVDAGATQLVMLPAPDGKFTVSCTTSFRGCPVDPQFLALEVTPDSFREELAGARTFVDFRDLGQLLAMGLVKGGSLDNAAIIHDGAMICKEKLRYVNEIVRHKILDIVGDLFLTGRRVRAHVIAVRPGHQRNVELANLMLRMLREENL